MEIIMDIIIMHALSLPRSCGVPEDFCLISRKKILISATHINPFPTRLLRGKIFFNVYKHNKQENGI